MVHRRVIEGREVLFGNHGALFGNAMTWWDHDTGSVWSQPLGEAILGPLRGKTLELVPSSLTTWGAWRDAHPDTLALDVPAGQVALGVEDLTIVVDLGEEVAAYPIDTLAEAGPANDVVAGVEIAVVVDPTDPARWAVFSRRLDDRVVELVERDGAIVDAGTGTEWDPARGVARAGPLAGEVLDLLPGFTAFAEDVGTFWPEAGVWGSAATAGALAPERPLRWSPDPPGETLRPPGRLRDGRLRPGGGPGPR
jgi:hypothetical protein